MILAFTAAFWSSRAAACDKDGINRTARMKFDQAASFTARSDRHSNTEHAMHPASFAAMTLLFAVALAGQARAQQENGPTPCLSEGEIQQEVNARRVVSPVAALRAASAAVGGETVRARLCWQEDRLVFTITALKRDGKVVHVTVEGASGRVMGWR